MTTTPATCSTCGHAAQGHSGDGKCYRRGCKCTALKAQA